MKKKYDDETESPEPTSTAYEGTGDFIQVGEKEIELYPGDKIQDNGPALVFFNGTDRDETDSFGGVRPAVDQEAFGKFKGMEKTKESSTGIWIYE
jgi:hypothetical protein